MEMKKYRELEDLEMWKKIQKIKDEFPRYKEEIFRV